MYNGWYKMSNKMDIIEGEESDKKYIGTENQIF